MRFLGGRDDCGPLLELSQVQRQLNLGSPVFEGVETISVAHIIGTLSRARDFDGCFSPVWPSLKKRIQEIAAAQPPAMDEPIEVVRVDRAYFVSDGHKRVAIAREAGREFIDARISHLPSPYALAPDVEEEAIERTAREGEFRRHSGLVDAVPEARFALTDIVGYGELLLAVQGYYFDRVQSARRMLTPAEGARMWYEDKYLPMVAEGREAVGQLLAACTDADLFLMVHRTQRAAWGSQCDDAGCIADMLLAEQRRSSAGARAAVERVFGRDQKTQARQALLLPLSDQAGRNSGD